MLFRGIWFCLNFVFAFLAILIAMSMMQRFLGLQSSLAVLVILPPIIASMIEGQVFGRRYRARPSNRLCWLASLRMTAMVVLISLSVLLPQLLFDTSARAELEAIDPTGRTAAFVLLIALAWCLLRLGYSIGLATELKGQQFSDE